MQFLNYEKGFQGNGIINLDEVYQIAKLSALAVANENKVRKKNKPRPGGKSLPVTHEPPKITGEHCK